jgi:hypothetical protein
MVEKVIVHRCSPKRHASQMAHMARWRHYGYRGYVVGLLKSLRGMEQAPTLTEESLLLVWEIQKLAEQLKVSLETRKDEP